MSKHIRVGQIWRKASGRITEIVGKATKDGYEWLDCFGAMYTDAGRFHFDGGSDVRDLDTLIYDPHDQPAETELERKAWELYCKGDHSPPNAFAIAQVFIDYRDTLRHG
jgi:hypothetical protein